MILARLGLQILMSMLSAGRLVVFSGSYHRLVMNSPITKHAYDPLDRGGSVAQKQGESDN